MEDSHSTSSPRRKVLISGGAQGIGRCLARTFLQKGHSVFILDIDQQELSHTVEVHLKPYAGRVSSTVCNLRDIQDIQRSVKAAADFFGGRIDVLINNGGIAHPFWKDGKTMEATETIQQWQAYMETNLTAPFVVSQTCIPFMKAVTEEEAEHSAVHNSHAGPCIIHIGSFRAQQSDPNQEGYASSKAGLEGLTHSMAVSLEDCGIRVNLIAPGRISVIGECRDGDEKGVEWVDNVKEDDIAIHLTNRSGRPEDIAQTAEFLVEAGFITGQVITVDGGVTKMKTRN
ncbi:short chain alcohol dehydrogenase [Phlyctema vagabunda]|uniref:Short chain alcohol dehydrogenase n=1 Tax=Phlyctema vagabunda TaxID=108571 RepID=A0ABR4PM28_9HELO